MDDKVVLKNRQPIWEAISNFYLDTELQDSDYTYITSVFAESGKKIEELKEIDLFEVFPALYINTLSIAGEWALFDSRYLYESCEKNYFKKPSIFFRAKYQCLNYFLFSMRKHHWKEMEMRLKQQEKSS